jgi:putative membrane protein
LPTHHEPQDDKPTIHPDPRTILSNERTFLAWMRTGIALMAFGFVVSKFGIYMKIAAHTQFGPNRLGLTMVGGGILFIAAGAIHYHRVTARLQQGLPLTHSRMPTVMGLVMVIAGLVIFFYLFQAA